MMFPYGPTGGAMVWVGFIFMLLFWALIILGIVALVTWVGRQGRPQGAAQESPLDILKKRYAKGEISKDDYESMKKELGG